MNLCTLNNVEKQIVLLVMKMWDDNQDSVKLKLWYARGIKVACIYKSLWLLRSTTHHKSKLFHLPTWILLWILLCPYTHVNIQATSCEVAQLHDFSICLVVLNLGPVRQIATERSQRSGLPATPQIKTRSCSAPAWSWRVERLRTTPSYAVFEGGKRRKEVGHTRLL